MVVGLIAATAMIAREQRGRKRRLEKSQENVARAEAYFREARQGRRPLRHPPRGTAHCRARRRAAATGHAQRYARLLSRFHPPGRRRSFASAVRIWRRRTSKSAPSASSSAARQALAAYHRAADLLQQLAVDQPDDGKHLADVAICNNNIGWLLQQTGKDPMGPVTPIGTPSRYRSGSLRSEHADAARYRNDLSITYGNLGLLEEQVEPIAPAIEVIHAFATYPGRPRPRLSRRSQVSGRLGHRLQQPGLRLQPGEFTGGGTQLSSGHRDPKEARRRTSGRNRAYAQFALSYNNLKRNAKAISADESWRRPPIAKPSPCRSN